MTSQEILEKFFKHLTEKGHKLVPNVSLVPENDPTLLYVNSGMFPLVPYLSGEPHPLGKRIMNVQRCLRFFEDVENIGTTNRHTTAFHMIGNWSLGDYFKDEQLNNVYKFIFEDLKLDPKKTYASVFVGDKDAPKDMDSVKIIQAIFARYGIDAKLGERIFEYGKKDNWWQRGEAIGELGGPDSEIFYYVGGDGTGLGKNPADAQDEFLEIGNSVFMQYRKAASGWEELPQKNVDFGGGLERLAMVSQGKSDIYLTDNFYPLVSCVEKMSGKEYGSSFEVTKAMRILADHMRSAAFLAMDGVTPSNKDQGYILRRLLRRMVRYGRVLGIEKDISVSLVPIVVSMFSWLYPDLNAKQTEMQKLFAQEEDKFRKTLNKGASEFSKKVPSLTVLLEKLDTDSIASIAFDMYQSLGYPSEMFFEDIKDLNPNLSEELLKELEEVFKKKFDAHQELSRQGAQQKFEGGLADHSEQTVKYHTATHILNMALRKVLGEQIMQKGSNITGERLRFDFNYGEKIQESQLKQITDIINSTIEKSLPVNFVMLPKEDAEKVGAVHAFNEKYGDTVKVYFIGDSVDDAVSKEFCGGPHVKNTSDIGSLTIFKVEKIGDNLTRIYAK